MRLSLTTLLLFLTLSCNPMNTEVLDICGLEGLTEICEFHVGSVKQLQLIRSKHVLNVPDADPDLYQLAGEIQVEPGEGFRDYHFLINQAIFEESSRETRDGTIWEQQIRITRQGLEADTAAELARLTDGHYLAIVTLYTGARRLVGSLQSPLKFQGRNTTNLDMKDYLRSSLELNCTATCPAYFIDGEALVPESAAQIPYSALLASRSNECDPVEVDIAGSRRISGELIDRTTPSQVQLVFTFGNFKRPYYGPTRS